MNAKIIVLPESQFAVVSVGATGFKSTLNWRKATKFSSSEEAVVFARERGIFKYVLFDACIVRPSLTPFEAFVLKNQARSPWALATETNRTEGAVFAALSRAVEKTRTLSIISTQCAQ